MEKDISKIKDKLKLVLEEEKEFFWLSFWFDGFGKDQFRKRDRPGFLP